MDSNVPRVAYGFEVIGTDIGDLLTSTEPGLRPLVVKERAADAADPRPAEIGPARAHVPLVGGEELLLDRAERQVQVPGPIYRDSDALAHPTLTLAAAVFAHWDGREALHAGAFAVDGGAWALIGDRGSGKSSLLAALAGAGAQVLSDDLLVFDGVSAFCGPRCLDLRDDAARQLGLESRARTVRIPPRLRVSLPPAPFSVPLRGSLFLGWGDKTALAELPAAERLEALLAARTLGIVAPSSPELIVSLAALPSYRLSRPRDWASAGEGVDVLLSLAAR